MNVKFAGTLAASLALAAALAACGGVSGNGSSIAPTPTSSPSTPSASADVTITITGMNGGNSYSPNPGTLKAGQKVAFRNADSIAHTATADGGSFDTGTIAPGATSNPITLATAGTLNYHCRFHPDMTGTLNVTQ